MSTGRASSTEKALAARDCDAHFDDARVDWTNAAFDRAVDAALNRAINS